MMNNMILKLLLATLLAVSNLHAEEIREYYFGWPMDKIKSYTMYDCGEYGEMLVNLKFSPAGELLYSKTPNYNLTIRKDQMVAADKDGKHMEFIRILGVIIPTIYVDKAANTDLTFTLIPEANALLIKGTLNGKGLHIGKKIDGDMPSDFGDKDINEFYLNALNEFGEVQFVSQIAKYDEDAEIVITSPDCE